ncbi:hypothetical protein ONZ45_g14169 [Pleurotus djamor]|nr:hypothetical protein ONZ45_g14169 [Pleurotus djamor]
MDYSRPPPPQGPPPTYAFVTRYYKRSLRPFVAIFAFLSALWTLFSSIGFFRAINIDRAQNSQLGTFSIVLGSLYMALFLIESLGLAAAATQRVALVRIYALLSSLAFVIVLATGLMRVVIHFLFKNDLIAECSTLTEGRTFVFRYGLFGPIRSDVISQEEADRWCRRAWDHDSWAEIISLLITLFLAAMFAAVAFAYYRQVLDPTSPANATRAPSSQARAAAGGYPNYYNPPYNAQVPHLGYNQQYPPPAGPPPPRDEAFVPPYDNDATDGKPPGYTGAGV